MCVVAGAEWSGFASAEADVLERCSSGGWWNWPPPDACSRPRATAARTSITPVATALRPSVEVRDTGTTTLRNPPAPALPFNTIVPLELDGARLPPGPTLKPTELLAAPPIVLVPGGNVPWVWRCDENVECDVTTIEPLIIGVRCGGSCGGGGGAARPGESACARCCDCACVSWRASESRCCGCGTGGCD